MRHYRSSIMNMRLRAGRVKKYRIHSYRNFVRHYSMLQMIGKLITEDILLVIPAEFGVTHCDGVLCLTLAFVLLP